jgi:eukaryotic-like serine/threonine-protein kinase
MIGTVFGNYRLVDKLGQGGMGEVYLAEHRRIPRRVAIKVLLPELSSTPAVVERFFTEARATATINHPSIVEIVDCDVQDGRAYIVMALLEGESLGKRLRRPPPVRVDEALEICRQVADGMAAAHAKGIVHRDLKPDNVFLVGSGAADAGRIEVKILDFGIAKLAADGTSAHTRTGTMMGTPAYMSPEQCRGAGRVDLRTDVYSLGCILFEALCGRPPFVHEGFGELISAHMSEPPPSPAALNLEVPPDVDELCQSLLAKGAEQRPQTMGEVGARLGAVAARSGGAAAGRAGQTKVMGSVGGGEAGVGTGTGTKVMAAVIPARSTTTFSQTTGEIDDLPRRAPERARALPQRRSLLLPVALGGAVIVLAVVAAVLMKRGGSRDGAHEAEETTAEPKATAAAAGEVPGPAATVTVELGGTPAGTVLTVDGAAAIAPLKWARGPETHRLVLRAPGYRDKELTVDASRDRLIDISMEAVPAPPNTATAAEASATPARSKPGRTPSPARERPRRPPKPSSTVEYGTTDL